MSHQATNKGGKLKVKYGEYKEFGDYYKKFVEACIPQTDHPVYTGSLADTPMAFEHPVLDWDKYAYHKGCQAQGTDWDENVNYERMRSYRLERTREQLNAFGVGAILSINEWNTRYITGTWTPAWTTPSSGLRYCLFAGNAKAPILYEQAEIGYHTRQMCPWLDKVKVAITGTGWSSIIIGSEAQKAQREKLVKQVLDDLKAYGMDKEVLALDVTDPSLFEGFQNAGIKVSLKGQELMFHARKIKNRDEVECLRIAAAIAEAQFQAIKDMLKPGVRENEIMGAMHKVAYDLGGEVSSGMLVTSGEFCWPNSRIFSANRIIRPGDLVFADTYNTSFSGYKTCIYRTFCCGKATQRQKDDYARALDWLYASINVIKPGVTTREVCEQWPASEKVWSDILIKHEDQTAGSNWMHGIGLTLYELPLAWRAVSLEHPLTLEEGMTFAIETQLGTIGSGAARLEEMLRITHDGVEVLTKWPIGEITEVDY
jgi:Xaa-Pro aminopeptidase